MNSRLRTQVDMLIHYVDQGLALCRDLKLVTSGTRFAHYLQWLRDLRALLANGDRPTALLLLTGSRNLTEEDRARTRYLAAIVEGQELAAVVPFLAMCASTGRAKEIRPKLKQVLGGPDFPEDENDENKNEARNIQFELTMASQLNRSSLALALGHNPDLACTIGGTQLFIQCKRPLRNVASNITRASSQLKRDIQAMPSARGIIMLSVDNVEGFRGVMLNRMGNLDPYFAVRLDDELKRTLAHYLPLIDRLPAQIVEVDFVASAPMYEIESDTFNRTHRVCYWIRAKPGSDEHQLLTDFHAKVQSAQVPYPHLSI